MVMPLITSAACSTCS